MKHLRHIISVIILLMSMPISSWAVDWYLVSPQLTGGQKLEAFKLSPARHRNGGAIEQNMVTFNIKDVDMKKLLVKNGYAESIPVYYHFEASDGAKKYAHSSSVTSGYNGYFLGKTGTTATLNNNVRYETYKKLENSGKDFVLVAGEGVSYSWIVDPGHTTQGCTICINLHPLQETASKSFFVVGNFQSALATVNIQPWQEDSRAKMQRLIFRKATPGVGVPSSEDWNETTMDSVVYRTTIGRPKEGWGNLFIAVVDEERIRGWQQPNSWNYVIRPQVHNYGSGTGSGAGMDATALVGGLFWCNGTADNKSQALNPLLSDEQKDASSYTFSMNVTTSTYRISFNTGGMYILGSAIASTNAGAEEDKVGMHHLTAATAAPIYQIRLEWDGEEQCFKNMQGGVETPIVFGNEDGNRRFRFAYGPDFRNTWFGENGPNNVTHNNVPTDLRTSALPYTAAPDGYDTQYVNYLSSYRSTEDKYADPAKDLLFGLPKKADGSGYIIRLYLQKEGENVKYFYTIDRKISLRDVGKTLGGKKYVRAFSEYHAMKVPEGVDVYFVTSTSAANKTVTLTKSTLDYIPARTGVILASDEKKVAMVTYAKNPEEPLPAGITNLLKAATADMAIPEQSGATYNYILGVYKDKLGFYHPEANVRSGRNYAYLKSTANVTSSAAKGFTFVVEDEETTGITSLQDDATADDAWYNLQGIQVGRPTTRGIYIHRGRKVVIR